MSMASNRMLPRAILVSHTTDTVIVGVGREGCVNGGTVLNVTVECSGGTVNGTVIPPTAGIVTVTVSYRTTSGSALVPDATKVAIPIGGIAIIGTTPSNTCVYEIVVSAQTAALADESIIVSALTTSTP